MAVSNPYVEAWAASPQRKATVLDLLRSPRLPLALVATVMMAISFAALETVSPSPLHRPETILSPDTDTL